MGCFKFCCLQTPHFSDCFWVFPNVRFFCGFGKVYQIEIGSIHRFKEDNKAEVDQVGVELMEVPTLPRKTSKITPNLTENTSCLGLIVGLILVICSYL